MAAPRGPDVEKRPAGRDRPPTFSRPSTPGCPNRRCSGPGTGRDDGDVLTQIYGLTTVADARDVDRLCPDHVGVVVDEGKDAWDSVDEATAVAVAGAVENARVVALSLSTNRSGSGPPRRC